MKCELSRQMYHHGLWGEGEKLGEKTQKLLGKKLLQSSSLMDAINKCLEKTKKTSIDKSMEIEFENNESEKDLYYSLQHTTVTINGKKTKGNWNLQVEVTDRYDFTTIRSFERISFGNAANDLGYAMQKIKMMIPYNIKVIYKVKWGIL